MPSIAIREIETLPYPLLWDVLAARGYASAKRALGDAKKESDVPVTRSVQWVWQVMAERMKRRRAERGT